jgi:hypothetical protein
MDHVGNRSGSGRSARTREGEGSEGAGESISHATHTADPVDPTNASTYQRQPPPPPPAIHSDSTRRNLYSKFFAIYGSPDGGLPEFEFRLRVGGRGEGSMGRSNG